MSPIHIRSDALSQFVSPTQKTGTNWIAKDPDGTIVFNKTPNNGANFWTVAAAFYDRSAAELMQSPKLRREAQRWSEGDGAVFYATIDDVVTAPTGPKASSLVTPAPSLPSTGPTLVKIAPKAVTASSDKKVAEQTAGLHRQYLDTRTALVSKYEAAKATGDVGAANKYGKQIKALDEAALQLQHTKASALGEHGIYSLNECTALRESLYTSKRLLGATSSDAAHDVGYLPGVPLLDDQMHLVEPKAG